MKNIDEKTAVREQLDFPIHIEVKWFNQKSKIYSTEIHNFLLCATALRFIRLVQRTEHATIISITGDINCVRWLNARI